MNILVVGVCDVPSSTNTFIGKELVNLGHKVECYNYRTYTKNLDNNIQKMNTHLLHYLYHTYEENKKSFWDLIIFCKTDTVYPEVLDYAFSLTNTFYWFMDPLPTAKGMRAHLLAKRCHTSSATALEVVNYFNNNGANCYRIPEGVDINLYKPLNLPLKYDVVFFGSHTGKREQIIKYLRANGIKIKLFGKNWPEDMKANPPIYNEDLVKLINETRITIQISHSNSYSDRILLVLASGGFILAEDVCELQIDFTPGNELDVWDTKEQLLKKIKYYLSNYNKALEIRQEGPKIAKNLTWNKICKEMLEVAINGKNNVYS